ncbi:MAG: hypothetical protein ACRD0D_04170 [Acidimicrobiales bacterium]
MLEAPGKAERDRLTDRTGPATRVATESTPVGFVTMSRYLDAEDLIDAKGVAELLGLAQRNTVSAYQRRYPAMPRPVVNLGKGCCKLWLGSEIEVWRAERWEGTRP